MAGFRIRVDVVPLVACEVDGRARLDVKLQAGRGEDVEKLVRLVAPRHCVT
jgi:hypothetical protein